MTGYRVVDRAIKYGVLFIALTFATFLCFELTVRRRFHPVQYGVVGMALVLFYMTLLSLTEHLPFELAYLASTVILTGMISLYVKGITRSRNLAGLTALLLGGLYAVLYVLLTRELFALLLGTAVLLICLSALMLSTRTLSADVAARPNLKAESSER